MLQSRVQNGENDPHDRNEVDRWLRRLLADEGGFVERAAVLKTAKASGYPDRTIANAARRLRLKSEGVATPRAPQNGTNDNNGRNHS